MKVKTIISLTDLEYQLQIYFTITFLWSHIFISHPVKVDRHWLLFNSRCNYCSMKYDVIGRAETSNEDAK